MSRVVRISDGTFERLKGWAQGAEKVEEMLSRVLDAADLGIVVCGVCGKRAPKTEAVLDTWHPEVWAAYEDGTTTEVSPVCCDHEVIRDEATDGWLVRLPRRDRPPHSAVQ